MTLANPFQDPLRFERRGMPKNVSQMRLSGVISVGHRSIGLTTRSQPVDDHLRQVEEGEPIRLKREDGA
jgi:hypothetical protein